MNCDILDLRAFLMVVETGGFHRAAEKLNISQPALTRRIQKLEQIVDAPLLERTTRHVAPTATGTELLPLVRRLLDEFDSTLFSIRDAGRAGGHFTLACVPTAAFYFLPGVIQKYSERYPNIRVSILDLPAIDGLQAVARGEAEFGINFLGGTESGLIFDKLADDPFVLAARRDHPLASQDEVHWSDLEPHRLITVHRASGNRTLLDAGLAHKNIKLRWFYEVTHLSTSLGLVEAGLGVSVLPRLATPSGDHPILVTKPLENPRINRTIGVVRRQGARLSPPADRFLSLLLEMWTEKPD
ncbi:LysR family transcriptional regulator [Paracoccus caeni]|uniref:LysR family transcriptional regulator n=1 Tax=Paracoccus caeni TaxID=657651 RepID=A0A934SKN0_9RHOB|nr:LysR family transcriptional regulator [Paracoccus caeni]